ncbi:hypothetical protein [Microbacterium sp. T2.11-28]|uniref:hypothetical protein n=1 Tax=Microbacterium sp. T2.11-28 TaxID=3041169 RepID=UPI0024777181|nr:hypothetical protein [Microbacterium sp. T2.11-28]CAI9392044.1 hypothetical protein MICABA_01980 [Microbacterium sp. T2.11-28]
MTYTATPALVLGAAPRVNLMPRAEIERRANRKLIGLWGRGTVLALLLVVVTAAVTFWLQSSATQQLNAENMRTTDLLGQLAELQPVSAKLQLEAELRDLRAEAMSTDLEWAALTSTVGAALPESVSVSGFALTAGGAPVADDPSAEVGSYGTLTLTSEDPTDVVALVRSLRDVTGVRSVDSWSASAETGLFEYTVRIVFDQSFYTHAYEEGVTP